MVMGAVVLVTAVLLGTHGSVLFWDRVHLCHPELSILGAGTACCPSPAECGPRPVWTVGGLLTLGFCVLVPFANALGHSLVNEVLSALLRTHSE